MRRVLVIGPCGAGKSTLSGELGKRLGLPVLHMDQLNWKSGWQESAPEELRAKLNTVIAGETWLIDGTYGGTLVPRLEQADTVIYLDYPIRLCVTRLLRRIWTWRGRTRPDMTEGCPERFDLGFLLYLLQWNSGPRIRTEQRLKGHEGKVIRFSNPAQTAAWLGSLTAAAAV